MRKMKRLLSLLTAFVLLLAPLFSMKLTVQAEGEAKIYYVKYVASKGEWRYQEGSWDDASEGREFYYMYQNIKDGDSLVVDGAGDGVNACYVNIPDIRLGNFTALGSQSANITAKSVDEVYVLFTSTAVINGDVKKAYVYNDSVVNFNNNVEYLEVTSSIAENRVHAYINIVGTLDHLYAYDYNKVTRFECYDFKPGTFTMYKGNLNVLPENYSTTPSAEEPAAPVETPAETPTQAPADEEYDEVPKTGEMPAPYIPVMCVLLLCIAGKAALKKVQ